MKPLFLLFILCTCLQACKSDDWRDRYKGIGPWTLEKTTPKQFGGICEPLDENTSCQGLPIRRTHNVAVGNGQSAHVDAYFRGHKKDAPLIELELTVSKCKSNDLMMWARDSFGKPKTNGEKGLHWQGKFMHVFARPARERPECRVNYVSVKDVKRIESLIEKLK